MENGLAVLKGADMAEDVFQHVADMESILPHTVSPVGIGAYGDDLASQFPKSQNHVPGGKKFAAAIHAAGVDFQALAFGCQNPENLVDDLPVFPEGDGAAAGVAPGLAEIGQMGQDIKLVVASHAVQGHFQIPALCLKDRLILPVIGIIYIQIVGKMHRTQDKIKGPALKIPEELGLIIGGHTELHPFADAQPGNLQSIIFPVVNIRIKGHNPHLFQGIVVQMVGKANLFHAGGFGGPGHGKAGIVAVKGYPAVHMKIKHE